MFLIDNKEEVAINLTSYATTLQYKLKMMNEKDHKDRFPYSRCSCYNYSFTIFFFTKNEITDFDIWTSHIYLCFIVFKISYYTFRQTKCFACSIFNRFPIFPIIKPYERIKIHTKLYLYVPRAHMVNLVFTAKTVFAILKGYCHRIRNCYTFRTFSLQVPHILIVGARKMAEKQSTPEWIERDVLRTPNIGVWNLLHKGQNSIFRTISRKIHQWSGVPSGGQPSWLLPFAFSLDVF